MTATQTKLDQAKGLLQEWLAGGPLPASEIERRLEQAGISLRVAQDAKADVNILSKRRDDQWYWRLPEEPSSPEQERDERQRLKGEMGAINDEIRELEQRLPELALDDPSTFRSAHQRLAQLNGEIARLRYAITGYDRREERTHREREAQERERLQAKLDRLRAKDVERLTALRARLVEASAIQEEWIADELEASRIARQLGIPHRRRVMQTIEGLVFRYLKVGSPAHRRLPDRIYPEQENNNDSTTP